MQPMIFRFFKVTALLMAIVTLDKGLAADLTVVPTAKLAEKLAEVVLPTKMDGAFRNITHGKCFCSIGFRIPQVVKDKKEK